jgi:hypothetical protein
MKRDIRFRGQRFHWALGLTALLAVVSCQTPKPPTEVLRKYSSESMLSSTEPLKCKSLLDHYCNYLYSPEASGNLEVERTQSSIKVLQGETGNQFSQVFYTYARAKLKNQASFPKDFQRILKRHNYFGKLEEFLNRKPVDRMTLTERLEMEQTDYELNMIWSAVLNETTFLRMNRKFPGFHKLSDRTIPLELSLEEKRTRRNLISEISTALWRDDENWKRVEVTFTRLKESYLHLIDKVDASEAMKANWRTRIHEVRLVLPGSMPSLSNDECSSTTVNAFYYTHLNIVTVCAGDFNSEDILQTLAHEMGHALDIDRSLYLYQSQSKFGVELKKLRANVCTPRSFSCDKWNDFTNEFDSLLTSLDGYNPDLPQFQRCLKRRPTSKELSSEDVARLSSSLVVDRLSALASSDRFLRITKAEIPMSGNKTQKNPNYMDPCSYYLWSQGEEPVDDELTTLMFFTAAYRCSNEDPKTRLRSSIETAKEMTLKIMEKTIKNEGEFSDRSELESEGFSSPPGERFADVLGSYAMADYLSQLPQKWERRNKFLAGASWLCMAPSLASHYPEESSIEKEFVFNAHTEGDQRRKELFSAPIREVISCQKDFEFNECSLPLKEGFLK